MKAMRSTLVLLRRGPSEKGCGRGHRCNLKKYFEGICAVLYGLTISLILKIVKSDDTIL